MKKKIVSVVFVAAIAIAAGYTMKQNAEKNDLSDIALANVEALANGESGGLPAEEIIKNCRYRDGHNCRVIYNGYIWDNSNLYNK